MTIFRAFRFLPLALIAEAVSKSLGYRIECHPQKSQVTSRKVRRTGWNTASQFFQENRDDERASIVVRRISFRIVWHGEYCVLYDSSVVSHPLQMIQLYSRKMVENLFRVLRRKGGAWIPQALVVHAFKAPHVLLSHAIPNHVPRIEVRTFPHGVARGPIVQQLDRLFGNRLWVVEGNKHAALVVQQLDRVQVWSGDDRFSRAQGIGKRS